MEDSRDEEFRRRYEEAGKFIDEAVYGGKSAAEKKEVDQAEKKKRTPFISDIEDAFGALVLRDDVLNRDRSIVGSLALFLSFASIPFLAVGLVGWYTHFRMVTLPGNATLSFVPSSLLAPLGIIILPLVEIFVQAAIFQVVGLLTVGLDYPYKDTVNAFTLSQVPNLYFGVGLPVVLLELGLIGYLGALVLGAVGAIWQIAILAYALAAQQGLSKITVVVLEIFIVVIVTLLL
jgi:hypothetical protein